MKKKNKIEKKCPFQELNLIAHVDLKKKVQPNDIKVGEKMSFKCLSLVAWVQYFLG